EPATAGLDAEAMLFAAGRASVRPARARFVWPALTGCLAVLSVLLGVWLAGERAERVSLTQQLRPQAPAPGPSPPAVLPEPPTSDGPNPNSVLAARRALEQGLEAWPPMATGAGTPGAGSADSAVLRMGRYDALPDQ